MAREMDKDKFCHKNTHGCRLVSDGMVCKVECEWLSRLEPGHLTDAKLLLACISDRAKKSGVS
jgi:hypothetical protein